MNRPARVIVGVSCAAAVVGLTWWGLTIMSDPPVENKSAASVNERPTPAPVRTVLTEPTPTATPTPAPLDRGGYTVSTPIDVTENVAPPLPAVIAPPVVVNEPTVNEDAPYWAQGLYPCAVEDDDNCYWDAVTMGNGGGFSFVTIDGVTTYPAVSLDPSSIPACEVEDDSGCYFPGIERGELANWVNAPDLSWTWFFDGVTDDLNEWAVYPIALDYPKAFDWRSGYVPCETPTGSTMTVGCYWDHGAQPYIVTDDGEKFLIDPANGDRTYAGVPS